MNRYIYIICVVLSALSLLLLGSCGNGDADGDEGQTYLVRGTVSLDSTYVDGNKLVLFTDNHRALTMDTIRIAKDGSFEHEGHTNGLDELYLCCNEGELCRFYASGNMEVSLSVSATQEEGVKVEYLQSPTDSINDWLQQQKTSLDGKVRNISRGTIDSLIRSYPTDVRVTLLLREQMAAFNDSLYIRQCLGSLKDVAKPDWIKKSIDITLSAMGSGKKNSNSRRLQSATFELADTIIDLSTSRSDYLLVCFWADYSKPSIDTLRALAKLIDNEYDNKRVTFMSCCLHAEDSAMWRIRTNFLSGKHTWVKGGFSDPRMRAWDVQQVPGIILMDMYCNQQQRNVWGQDLRKALDRLPNRVGYQKKN